MLAGAIGSVSCASYSTFCKLHFLSSPSLLKCPTTTDGRRPVYVTSLPLMCAGSLGVALSRTVHELMVWRFLQAFGMSAGISVGSGVIGDIYKLEERYFYPFIICS
jgi:MFS family permease